jgi:hypothetical protein
VTQRTRPVAAATVTAGWPTRRAACSQATMMMIRVTVTVPRTDSDSESQHGESMMIMLPAMFTVTSGCQPGAVSKCQ